MTPPSYQPHADLNTANGMASNDLRFLASIASNHNSSNNQHTIAHHGAPYPPHMVPVHGFLNPDLYAQSDAMVAQQWMHNAIASGAVQMPSSFNYNSIHSRTPPTTNGRSYKDDRRGFLLFAHVLLKCLGKSRSQPDLFYQARDIVRECTSCQRAGIPGYSPLVDIIEGRLRELDGMRVHWDNAERYMNRYREKKRLKALESVVQI